MKILGENSPEEMALPPNERTIKIGTKLNTSALELALAINEFITEKVLPAIAKVCTDDGKCHLELLDFLEMSRDFVCAKVREQWEREWRASHPATESEVRDA